MSAAVRIATASASRTIASAYVSSDEIAIFPLMPFVRSFAIFCPSKKIRHTPDRAYGEKNSRSKNPYRFYIQSIKQIAPIVKQKFPCEACAPVGVRDPGRPPQPKRDRPFSPIRG